MLGDLWPEALAITSGSSFRVDYVPLLEELNMALRKFFCPRSVVSEVTRW
jgi:hypothetical protein